jgi:carbonic anhydrase
MDKTPHNRRFNQSTDTNKAKLFLICPSCHIENHIRKHFDGSLFFLTALGSVFDTSGLSYASGMNELLINENISEIIIVNDSSCKFILAVLNNGKGFHTGAEEVLQILHSTCQIEIWSEKKMSRRAFKLAELNIKQQAQSLKETAYIGNKISNKEIGIKGLVYEREEKSFSEISLD